MSFQDIYNDPIIYRMRSGKGNDSYIHITQTDKVRNNTILLREIPDKFQGVVVSDGTNTLSTIDSGLPDSNKVVVDWTNGLLTFHEINNGKTYTINFYGKGNIYLPSSKVFTQTDENGNVTETLKTLTDDTRLAKDDANTAKTNANTQATYAKDQGDYAKGIRDNFGHKGNYSPTATYKNGNVVTYGGINYFCIQDTTVGIDPLNGAYWTVVSPQAAINQKTWTATANQTVFTITNGNYVVGQGNIEVSVGGVPQVTGIGFTETNSTTITLSEGVPVGTIVFAKWFEGAMSITKGHKTSHELGGQDELDITKLKNFQEQVASPLAENANNFDYLDVLVGGREYNFKGKAIGGKGNGSDDTTAFQTASTLLANGGSLFFPDGNFLIRSTFNGQSNMKIKGNGKSSRIYTDVGSVDNGLNMIVFIEKEGFSIENINVEGSGYGENFPAIGDFTGMGAPILLIGCKDFTVTATYTSKSGKYYPTITGSSDKSQGVANIYLSSCRDGIVSLNHATQCASGIVIDDWYSKNAGKSGFYTKNLVVDTNVVNDGSVTGVCVDVDANTKMNDITVIANKIRNMGFAGLEAKGCSHSTFVDNTINGNPDERVWGDSFAGRNATMHGMVADFGARDCLIKNNKFIEVYQTGALLNATRNFKVKDNVVTFAVSDHASPNGILFVANGTTDFGYLEIEGNEIEVMGTNAQNGNNVTIDLTNATKSLDLSYKGNKIKGKRYGLNVFGSQQLNKFIAGDNTFSDDGTFILTAYKIDFGRFMLFRGGDIATYILRYQFIGSSSMIESKGNMLEVVSYPYKFSGNIGNLILADIYDGATTGYIFDTVGATITNSDASEMKVFNIDFSKFKNAAHPKNCNVKAGTPLTVGYWAVGDENKLTPTASGNIGQVCVTEGSPGTWKNFGTIQP